jgi:hypothetical protein
LPALDAHLSQAKHNESVALFLLQHDYPDWAVTAFFYAALHYVEAVLAQNNQHSGNHPIRDNTIGRTPSLKGIYREYRYLKTLSNDARYRVKTFSAPELLVTQSKFTAIKNHIQKALSLDPA